MSVSKSLIVQKFGGTSVADPDKIRAAARKAIRAQRDGYQVLMVVSAMGKNTDVLIELANGAGQLTPAEYRGLRQSISDRNLLFKVRSTNIALKPQSAQL